MKRSPTILVLAAWLAACGPQQEAPMDAPPRAPAHVGFEPKLAGMDADVIAILAKRALVDGKTPDGRPYTQAELAVDIGQHRQQVMKRYTVLIARNGGRAGLVAALKTAQERNFAYLDGIAPRPDEAAPAWEARTGRLRAELDEALAAVEAQVAREE